MSNLQKIQQLHESFQKILEQCPELVFVGDQVLRQKTAEVTLEEGVKIGNKLIEILTRYRSITGYGRGLAAPQIGENKSVFVTFLNDQFQIYINPILTQTSSTTNFYREACISCGYVSADVERPSSITLEYMNEKGEKQMSTADSFLARLLQHEYDHLQGIVNIDIAESGSINFLIQDPLKEQLRDTR